LLPFFILILVEIILHLCNYGYDTSLFIEDKTGKYYHLNPEISQKYFAVQENATRENVELFTKVKKPGTFRIFALGESTTVGFPYMHNGAFPRMLKCRLQFEYPTINFEIINLSLTAVNSYTLSDFSRQLVNFQPNVHFVDVMHVFELHSPHAILDSTLFLELVHPNMKGQQLISDAFYTELKKTGLLPVLKEHDHSLSTLPKAYPDTAFDSIFGRISIWLLKKQWPFNEPIEKENPLHIKTVEEQIAGASSVKQLNWFNSMHSLYDLYKQKNDLLVNALHIMKGLCLEFPFEQEYFLLSGKLSFMQNKEQMALFYLNKANQFSTSREANSLIELMKHQQQSENLKRNL